MIGLNSGKESTAIGAFFHMINHALFKSTLFLAAGLIIRRYQTRNLYEIKGVFKNMPVTATATALAILGITGAPFFNGSVSKYWIGYGSEGTWLYYGLQLVNFGTILSFAKFSTMLFGKVAPSGVFPDRRSVERLSEIIVFFMGSLCLLGGVFSESLTELLFGLPLQVSLAAFPMKVLTYVLTVLLASAVYYGVLKRTALLKPSGRFELTFNGIVASQTGFFAFLLLYVFWVNR